jgi:hypothetical protein
MWLKMCPRCGGDLYLRQEIDGNDIVCLQCGRTKPAAITEGEGQTSRQSRQSGDKRIAA